MNKISAIKTNYRSCNRKCPHTSECWDNCQVLLAQNSQRMFLIALLIPFRQKIWNLTHAQCNVFLCYLQHSITYIGFTFLFRKRKTICRQFVTVQMSECIQVLDPPILPCIIHRMSQKVNILGGYSSISSIPNNFQDRQYFICKKCGRVK